MSITKKWFYFCAVVSAQVLVFSFTVLAQDFEAKIKVSKGSPSTVEIEGNFLKDNNLRQEKNWVFIRSFAGIENLGERVSDLKLSDNQNQQITHKKFIAGEYLAENEAEVWNYRLDLTPQQKFAAKSHISWLNDEQGILMPGDLFPQFQTKNGQKISARIKFELPDDWKVVTSEKNSGDNTFEVSDVQNAVFLVGKGWRENKVSFDKFVLNIATFGVWQFSDAESVKMSQSILESYTKIFGEIPNNKIQIALVPIKDKTGRWEAETRGNTLTIVSGDMPFKTNSLQRLHEQLRHELFHLWIPNDLALTGNYDWFYEGFAVYQSLRTGVQMNRIRFEDFLDTLGTAYYLVNFNEQQTSLIDASKTIQSGTNPQVYSKGMIAAFICDAAILEKSKGRSSIEEIFRRIYQEHHLPNKPQNGNRAVLNILKTKEELRPVVEKYIEGAGKIVWTKYLDNLGIEAIETDFKTQLKVKKKLSGRQKDLLDKLGYNNWRKISKK